MLAHTLVRYNMSCAAGYCAVYSNTGEYGRKSVRTLLYVNKLGRDCKTTFLLIFITFLNSQQKEKQTICTSNIKHPWNPNIRGLTHEFRIWNRFHPSNCSLMEFVQNSLYAMMENGVFAKTDRASKSRMQIGTGKPAIT